MAVSSTGQYSVKCSKAAGPQAQEMLRFEMDVARIDGDERLVVRGARGALRAGRHGCETKRLEHVADTIWEQASEVKQDCPAHKQFGLQMRGSGRWNSSGSLLSDSEHRCGHRSQQSDAGSPLVRRVARERGRPRLLLQHRVRRSGLQQRHRRPRCIAGFQLLEGTAHTLRPFRAFRRWLYHLQLNLSATDAVAAAAATCFKCKAAAHFLLCHGLCVRKAMRRT